MEPATTEPVPVVEVLDDDEPPHADATSSATPIVAAASPRRRQGAREIMGSCACSWNVQEKAPPVRQRFGS
jgi:hypothetical protein